MAVDLVQIREMAKEKEDENWRFRQFLKTRCSLPPEEIDRRVFEITRRVWAGIDCTACANCCRQVRPSFSEDDLVRLTRRLKMERQDLVEKYLEPADPDSDGPWQTRTIPCPFLQENRCSIYEDRPSDCRGYPYLDKPDFVSRTLGMLERTSTCPIVYEVMEELKGSLKFSHRNKRRTS
jgi:Fe-S-cluster containining protein